MPVESGMNKHTGQQYAQSKNAERWRLSSDNAFVFQDTD